MLKLASISFPECSSFFNNQAGVELILTDNQHLLNYCVPGQCSVFHVHQVPEPWKPPYQVDGYYTHFTDEETDKLLLTDT